MAPYKSLKHYQKTFLNTVLNEDDHFELLDEMVAIGELESKDVINVYRSDYRARLQEALESNYEACWMVLGDEDFAKACQDYISEYPSTFRNLAAYGEFFYKIFDDQLCIELAKFEWDFWQLFHQEDRLELLTPADLNQETVMTDKYQINENLYLHKSDYDLIGLWNLRKNEQHDKDLEDFSSASFICMYKEKDQINILHVTKEVFHILDGLKSGHSISEIFESQDKFSIDLNNMAPDDWSQLFQVLAHNIISK